jgi:hypothetical protein
MVGEVLGSGTVSWQIEYVGSEEWVPVVAVRDEGTKYGVGDRGRDPVFVAVARTRELRSFFLDLRGGLDPPVILELNGVH